MNNVSLNASFNNLSNALSRTVCRILICLIVILSPSLVESANLELSWFPNPETDVAGYNIYLRTPPAYDTTIIDVGGGTTYAISDLNEGTYYISLTAYDQQYNESAPTPEVAVTIQNSSEENVEETNYTSDSDSVAGCFIATAAYGSYLNPHVKILRDFRDSYLLTSSVGTAIVSFYYATSPPIANYISKHSTLRTITRLLLTPIVYGVKYPGGSLLIFGMVFISLFYVVIRKKRLEMA